MKTAAVLVLLLAAVVCVRLLHARDPLSQDTQVVRDRPSSGSLKIVRAYLPWKDHDPARPERTTAALAAYDVDCTSRSGPFELLRLDTSREQAAAIVREIETLNVPAAIEQAFARASAALPGGAITACAYAGQLSRGLPHLDGVGGVALGGGTLKLILHPTRHRFAKVPYTLAHEYHHEVLRASGPFAGPDDVVVREGKADHFAIGLYPDLRPPHTSRLSDEELTRVWPAFLEFRRSGTAQADFMVSARGPLPIWAGYRLAYEMVEQYATRTGADTRRLLTIPSAVIVEHFARSARVSSLARRVKR
jgi:hypothetical protein